MGSFSIFSDLITPTKYNIPDWQSIDPSQIQQQTAQGNSASFAANKQLATDYNAFMRQQQQQALQQGIPGYENITKQMSVNLQSQLKGELTTSDLAAVQRASAAQSVGSGTAGSLFGAALTPRNIGRRQADIQQVAQQQAGGYLNTIAGLTAAPKFDFSNVFLSPQQRIQTAFQNQTNQWNIQNQRNQMAVQPAPWEKALANAGDAIVNGVAAYYTGGMLGTGQTSQTPNAQFGNQGFNIQQYSQGAGYANPAGNYGPNSFF